MPRNEPTWMRVDVRWSYDPRSKALTPAENWLYMVVRSHAVQEQRNVLPPCYDGTFFVRIMHLRVYQWHSLLKKSRDTDERRPIIFLNADGCICLPNLGLQHKKLHWKDKREGPQPPWLGGVGGDIPPVREDGETLKTHHTTPTTPTIPTVPTTQTGGVIPPGGVKGEPEPEPESEPEAYEGITFTSYLTQHSISLASYQDYARKYREPDRFAAAVVEAIEKGKNHPLSWAESKIAEACPAEKFLRKAKRLLYG